MIENQFSVHCKCVMVRLLTCVCVLCPNSSQNFLLCSKKAVFTDVPTGCNFQEALVRYPSEMDVKLFQKSGKCAKTMKSDCVMDF